MAPLDVRTCLGRQRTKKKKNKKLWDSFLGGRRKGTQGDMGRGEKCPFYKGRP